jgi:hypothetical protein
MWRPEIRSLFVLAVGSIKVILFQALPLCGNSLAAGYISQWDFEVKAEIVCKLAAWQGQLLFLSNDELAKSRKISQKRRLRKKLRRQGAQILRNETYRYLRRYDDVCSPTQHPDFLRSRQ